MKLATKLSHTFSMNPKDTLFKLFFILMVYCLGVGQASATHIRAGDLTAVRVSSGNSLTYRFTVLLYRDRDGVPAQNGTFEFGYVTPGGGPRGALAGAVIAPTSLGFIDDGTELIIYQAEHTFPGPGTYRVSYYEQNRNPDVRNMFASVNTPFYIVSEFRVSPIFGLNSSPVLLIPPIDRATVGQKFIHNPGAFDSEGDSLSYRLTICKQDRDERRNYLPIEVTNYRFPDNAQFGGVKEDNSGPATLTLDPVTGDLIWDAPGQPGEYNVAFFVDEWRDGTRISSVNRDMQIVVLDNPNKRPRLIIPRDTCVVAGSLLRDTISASDPDRNRVVITGEGALFRSSGPTGNNSAFPRHTNPAKLTSRSLQPPNGYDEAIFEWQTDCRDVRREPYQATFKVVDEPANPSLKLVDLQTWRIRVVGPAPENLTATPDFTLGTITLNWDNYACANAEKMTIWRRKGGFDFEPDNCETGLPPYTGYQKIGERGIGTTTFLDSDIDRGVNYCYRIFAVFREPGGGESYASQEVCVFIPQLAPYLVEVSVRETSRTTGKIDVRWTRPIGVDQGLYPKPWTYRLVRADQFNGRINEVTIPQIFNEQDTFYTDGSFDTERLPYHYKVEFFSNGTRVDTSSAASSVFLDIDSDASSLSLNWQADVPWTNASNQFPRHYIYRESPQNSGSFVLMDSVDVTTRGFRYVDKGTIPGFPIVEKQEYCYKVLTIGTYDNPQIRDSLLNFSQEACGVILDTVAPCPPVLTLVNSLCESTGKLEDQLAECGLNDTLFNNLLTWENDLSGTCDPEIVSYRVYYAPRPDAEFELLAQNVFNEFFQHDNITSIAGCYYVTALDATGNESEPSNIECIDNCPYYELPNVFTPNGDGKNDTFRAFRCPRFIQSVKIEIYNRWGQLVFEGDEDFFVNWDGKDLSGNDVPTGVYFYLAKLKTVRLNQADEEQEVKGWVQVMRGPQD